MQPIKKKRKMDKKAVSILIGYVLLISFAIIMGTVVYGWMKSYIPKDLTDCPEGSAVFIKDVSCNIDTLELKLTLENRGRFDVAGYFIHATNDSNQTLATIDLSQKHADGGIVHGNSIIFSQKNNNSIKPGTDTGEVKFDLDEQIYSIEVTPVRFQLEDGKQRFASCGDAKVKQIITCSALFTPLSLSSLVSWWKFDLNLNDSSGSNDGVAEGTPVYTPGMSGQAGKFSSGNIWNLSVPKDSSLEPTAELSVAVWINTSVLGGDKTIVRTLNWSSSAQHGYFLRNKVSVGAEGVVFIINNGTQSNLTKTDTPISNNQWHFIVGTFDGQNISIYVDGNLKNTTNLAYPTTIDYAIDRNLTISRDFEAEIDEVMIFNKSLNSTEINQIYNYFT